MSETAYHLMSELMMRMRAMPKRLAVETGVSKASVRYPLITFLSQIAGLCTWNKPLRKTRKCLIVVGLVPRAGIEPARPILLYPRILSPELITHQTLVYQWVQEKSLSQKASNRRQLADLCDPSLAKTAFLRNLKSKFYPLFYRWGAHGKGNLWARAQTRIN